MRLTTLVEARTWYVKSDLSFWSFTQELERFASKMKDVIARRDRGAEATKFADLLLQAIELWKAGCIEEQTGWAVQNQPEEIWDAFRDAIAFMDAGDDIKALLAIMRQKVSEKRKTLSHASSVRREQAQFFACSDREIGAWWIGEQQP